MASQFNDLSESEKTVAALKSVLLDRFDLEREYEKESFKLQLKYQSKFEELHQKSHKYIHGAEITEKDCSRIVQIVNETQDLKKLIGEMSEEQRKSNKLTHFWLSVLENSSLFYQLIKDDDRDALSYITDIRSYQSDEDTPVPGFPQFNLPGLFIEFEFADNPFFTNKSLYKFYRLEFVPNKEDFFTNDGLIPTYFETSVIDWLPEKNLTERKVKKSQRNKQTKQKRVVEKIEKVESFFNFFTSLEDIKKEMKDEDAMFADSVLLADYDIGCELHTEIIPRSILHFMREINDDEDDDEDDEYMSDKVSESDSEEEQRPILSANMSKARRK